MVDNKKIKLPQHLQLDSVSPATRLLEKRRAMYEVQKAFEDQKEEFQKKEERFKMREAELREKDILIQDHLIKFSTFLQQHEMRRKKDLELAQQERERIKEKEEDIERSKQALESLTMKADKIDRKVKAMKKFELFLERVKEQNQDEFAELHDILSRYQTLKASNERLQENQRKYIQQIYIFQNFKYTEEIDSLNRLIATTTKDMNTMKMTLNNKIATKQQRLEKIEDQKGRLMAQSEENTSKKMRKTTEHGQILMTIDNLFQKCIKRKDMIISMKEFMERDPPRNFDDMQLSGDNALAQLNIVILELYVSIQQSSAWKISLDLKKHWTKRIISKKRNRGREIIQFKMISFLDNNEIV